MKNEVFTHTLKAAPVAVSKTSTILRSLILSVLGLISGISHSQTLQWARLLNDSLNYRDVGYAVITDGSNNVYVTGVVRAKTGMCGVECNQKVVTCKYNSSGTLQWTTTTDGPGKWFHYLQNSGDWESGYSMGIDGTYLWVAAMTYNSTRHRDDLTLFKYKMSTGQIMTNYPKCIKDTSGAYTPGGHAITVKDSTHVWLGGSTYDSISGIWRGVILKDSNNTNLWAWKYYFSGTSRGVNTADISDIKYSASGSGVPYVYATGYETNSGQGRDCFTVRLNGNTGVPTTGWPKVYNSSNNGDDQGNALILDTQDSVYVVGYARGSINSLLGKDALAISYNANGYQRWYNEWNSGNSRDDVYVDAAGFYTCACGTILFAGGYSFKDTTSGGYDCDYLLSAIYKSNGNFPSCCWSTNNPRLIDGQGTAPEKSSTDQGYGLEYSSTTEKFIYQVALLNL